MVNTVVWLESLRIQSHCERVKFSRGKFCVGAPLVHDGFEAVEDAAQMTVVARHGRQHVGQTRPEQAGVGAGEEQRHA